MKTQAWGWLVVAVLAAGLNSSYHSGGMEWAHRVVGRVGHNTSAVLALATGNADRFLTEAQIIRAHRSPSCPVSAVLAQVERSIAPSDGGAEQIEVMSAREEQQLARFEANRVRIQAQLARVSMANFNPVAVRTPKVVCPRVRVNIPEMPAMKMKMPQLPVVHVDYAGPGPV
jgi:hypothetical protein